jgi:excisionase family DNA binding protein
LIRAAWGRFRLVDWLKVDVMALNSSNKVQTVLLSAEAVGELLSVSVRTVRRMIASGEIPIVRIGRAVRIRRVDIEALIGRNLTGGTP